MNPIRNHTAPCACGLRAVIRVFILVAVFWQPSRPSQAQPAGQDTLRLGALYEAIERRDPRESQVDLEERATRLLLESMSAGRRPQIEFSARATYQTETVSIPLNGSELPLTSSLPTPPRDQYEVAAELRQLIYDGGRIADEKRVQQAHLAERLAAIRASLYALRSEVNAAFFSVLLHQEEQAQLRLLAEDLGARHRLVSMQARDGLAIPSDASALEAELIRIEQRITAAESARRAALRTLEDLIGRSLSPGDVLAIPDLEREARTAAAAVLDSIGSESALAETSIRPEFERFDAARERAQAESRAVEAIRRPRVDAFARIAAGRPGFDFFDDRVHPYAQVGVRAQWQPVDWGATARRAEATRLQADVITADEAAFTAGLRREVLDAVYSIERLESVLAGDAHAVLLRNRIERASLRRLDEGVLLAAEYAEMRNDVFEARRQLRLHRLELAEARVRLLTILGLPIPIRTRPDGPQAPIDRPIPFEASLDDHYHPTR